ncbi:HIRAN domain protein [compost metagenome]
MLFDIIESYTNCDFVQIPECLNLAGVTIGDRQSVIAKLNAQTPIFLKRDYSNQYDKNAIAVNAIGGIQLGWIPRQYAEILAPEMDAGVNWHIEIDRVVGNEETLRGLSVKLFHS